MAQTLEEALSSLSPDAQARVVATLRAGDLMQKMLSDSDAARQILPLADKAAKKFNPAHVTVEEQAQPIVDRVMKEIETKISARDKKSEEEQAVAHLNSQISDAKKNNGFTDEGIQKVLKLMQDKGIGDFELALKAYRYDNPAQPETPLASTTQMRWNTFETMNAGDQKGFFFPEGIPSITENPEAWEREMALKYLNGDVSLPTS